MTLRKSVFSVTADANGMGLDDNSLPANTGSRLAQVEKVLVDRSACFGDPTITITELDSTGAYLARQLVFIDRGAVATSVDEGELVSTYDVRLPVISTRGETLTSAVNEAREVIKSNKVRCEVTNANSGDVVGVTLVYESAGDYRF